MTAAIPITEDMRKDFIERSASLIARANAPKGLLSISDIAALTGFAVRGKTIQNTLASKDFPRAVLVGTREKRWLSSEVFRWLESRRI